MPNASIYLPIIEYFVLQVTLVSRFAYHSPMPTFRRFRTSKSTVLCTQYTPAEWHGRLGGGVQADAMVDRLVHGSVRIGLGDVNVRKLLAERK